jgi:murein DD-endopeptidase MepM/ murein hydrolase activator NlpD
MRAAPTGLTLLLLSLAVGQPSAGPVTGPFRLPTPNQALFEPGGESRFFAPTPGRDWQAGTFGCTRTEGRQLHEGIDILATQRDRQGEPTDPVTAAADGVVVYVNRTPALSNYGRYIVLLHRIEGLNVYTLYAHLRSIDDALRPGQPVRAGQQIGVVGRSTNTRTPIARDRAHLHFEIAFMLSDRFEPWFKRTEPGERNDHGNFNGQNFVGIDPAEVLRLQQTLGPRFSLLRHVQGLVPLCTVRLRAVNLFWVRHYPALVEPAPAGTDPVVGYELTFAYQGLPFRARPITAREWPGQARLQLVHVNEAETQNRPCQRMLVRRGNRWALSSRGERLLDLLAY